MVKELKILADNYKIDKTLRICWGFSCLTGESVLFDTGESNSVLTYNMNKMGIKVEKIKKQKVFEELHKVKKESITPAFQPERLEDIEEKLKKEQEEERFEREIDDLIDKSEKEVMRFHDQV